MTGHLERLQRSMRRLGDSSSGCGARLPAAATRLEALKAKLAAIDLVPYSRPRVGTIVMQEMSEASANGGTVALPGKAARIGLPSKLKEFNPQAYLSPLARQVYEEPDSFLLPEEDCPEPVRVRGTFSAPELYTLFQRWMALAG